MTKELNMSNLYQREGNSNADSQGDRHCNHLAQDQVSDFQEAKAKKKKRKTQSSKHGQKWKKKTRCSAENFNSHYGL